MSAAVHTILQAPRSQSVPISGDFPLDTDVLDKLPPGARVLSANKFGTSAWTVTARITVELPSGINAQFFLKCAAGESGRIMMEGEYNAMTELDKSMPGLVPRPLSWGRFVASPPDTYYLLSEFINMSDRMPNPKQLCSQLAKLHIQSRSPTGKFGMHVTTCQGRTPQLVEWESSWTTFFLKLMRHVSRIDFEVNGYWPELDMLEKRLIERVIPRLIGALESEGRTVKPCLIHADLWEGNTGTSYETGQVYIFDSGAFYAHNEMEIGDWRCDYNKIHNKVYTMTYLQYYKPSEPTDEWDDRNRAYSLYFNVVYSVNHMAQGRAVRQTAYDDMYYLIDKYAPFDEGAGPPRLQDSERASLSAERDHTKK